MLILITHLNLILNLYKKINKKSLLWHMVSKLPYYCLYIFYSLKEFFTNWHPGICAAPYGESFIAVVQKQSNTIITRIWKKDE